MLEGANLFRTELAASSGIDLSRAPVPRQTRPKAEGKRFHLLEAGTRLSFVR